MSETYKKLFEELHSSVKQMDSKDFKTWSIETGKLLPYIAARRVLNFIRLILGLGSFSYKEAKNIYHNVAKGNGKKYSKEKFKLAKEKINEFYQKTKAFFENLKTDPKRYKDYLPFILALALGVNVGSGGLDADGGIADLDIEFFGIDDHRSILSHSIIAGITAEFAILAVCGLTDIVISKLPDEHHIFWDKVSETKTGIAKGLMVGVSAGISYHLAIDGTIQLAAYKGLPVSLTMQGHQLIFLLNSAIEGLDATRKEDQPVAIYKANYFLKKLSKLIQGCIVFLKNFGKK